MDDLQRALGHELRQKWNAFCDCDLHDSGFIERMEAAGFAELTPVSNEALQDSFAADRGIEEGGMMWCLTPAGSAAFNQET